MNFIASRIVLALAIAGALLAQSPRGEYSYERTTSGSSEKVTLHLATGSERTARGVAATIYCASAATAALSRDGAAPTTTAATAVKLNSDAPTAAVVPYHTSNAGAGTSIKNYNIAAGQEYLIDLTAMGLLAGGNISLTPNLSGCRVYFQWREF